MNLSYSTNKYIKQKTICTKQSVVKLIRLNYFSSDDCTQIYIEGTFHSVCFFNTNTNGDFFTAVYDEICGQIGWERTGHVVIDKTGCVQFIMDAGSRHTNGNTCFYIDGLW